MNFESELKKGKFVVGECAKCHKVSWPPNESCNRCFGGLTWRAVKEPGTIIEWSAKDDVMFCMTEFEESVRVLGIISGNNDLKPGQKVKIASCDFDETPKFTFIAE
ncbi:MAG: Zn-ribbon domain-containing OB-fold protein [Candidatus Nitrosotenuis sp.]